MQWGARTLNPLLLGVRHRDQRPWRAAEACVFRVLEAQGGWEADNSIAALCKLVSGDCPLPSVSVRSPCHLPLPA